MKICNGLPQQGSCCSLNTTATLGTFDGVHIGHRRILEKVLSHASSTGNHSAVITFDKHPSAVLAPEKAPKLLTTLEEKLALFDDIGIDTAFVIPFTQEIAAMDPETFIARFLVDCLGIRYFIVGYDHGFGKDRQGSTEMLKTMADRFGFSLEIQPPITVHGSIVNSSEIRKLISEGDITHANNLLGRVYSMSGTVVRGRGIGKTIGFPTANIEAIKGNKIVPSNGVYAGWILCEDRYFDAVISIGPRITFDNFDVAVEAHAPGYTGDLYGKSVSVGFIQRLRDIVKFSTTDALVDQIKKDIEAMNQLLPL